MAWKLSREVDGDMCSLVIVGKNKAGIIVRLSECGAIELANALLFVADRNNHCVCNFKSKDYDIRLAEYLAEYNKNTD